MKKRILMICMCFTLIVAVISKDVHETKAFAIAPVGALVVGALALAGGIAVKNKDNLEMMTDDFTRFLDETLPDIASSWHELITKPITTTKVFISEKIRGAFYSYLEKKGWGQKVVTSIPVTTSASTLLNSLYAQIYNAQGYVTPDKEALANFMTKANLGDYAVCTYKFWEYENDFYFFLVEKDITDIYVTDRAATNFYPFDPLYGVRSDGTVIELSQSGYRFTWNDKGLVSIDSVIIDIGDIVYNSWRLTASAEEWGAVKFPSGINIWPNQEAYKTGNEDYIVHVTGTSYVNTDIDFTANSDYQNVASVIDVPVVGNMTVDEFIETIKDLAVDDTPAWIEAIDKITAVDVDTDVPVDTPEEDTKPTVPPLVSDFTADLTTLFPFCLPFDLIDLVKALSADPVAPKWEIPIKIKYGNVVNYKETFTIDMGNFDSVVKIFRTLETLGFIVGLIMITRNQMIKG